MLSVLKNLVIPQQEYLKNKVHRTGEEKRGKCSFVYLRRESDVLVAVNKWKEVQTKQLHQVGWEGNVDYILDVL